MAATTHISFSWALPVDALTFRANLEAYTNLRPTLELLHLCKRSENCRLPVDIVEMIESLLLEEERAHRREKFTQLLKCYESRCEQADHFEQDIRDRIEAESERDSILPFALLPFDCTKFSAPMWRTIRSTNAVPGLSDKIQEYRIACKTKHHENVDLWQVMDVTRRGIGVLRDDFGLCSRSVDYGDHTNASRWQKPPEWLYRSARYTNLRARSVIYLHLPEITNVPYCFGRRPEGFDRREFDIPQAIGPTVTDWTRQPVMPETPSVQSLSRFTRAVKILGLRPSNEVECGKSSEEREQQPALTMFVVDQYSDRSEEEGSYA
ncbi:hypothetical protein TI39_contig361g00002 [Zymoseptoria brevis]|uniref:Uncharacterized protein n=1 Tax=Zymoseptoria brevis TaxID=1047168 RepID=A0A0F4GQ51_9PEZI|nr:hypothetical protein TI39_contig361g00002 [Zymoseptoria brevis]